MDPLQIRESEVFETLKKLVGLKLEFVIIGGYAVNAYTLPRFSVDCDMVIKGKAELVKVGRALLKLGYKPIEPNKTGDSANFMRYEKTLSGSANVSLDILVGEVFDRQTGVSMPASWIFENSGIRPLKGKTIAEELKVRVINLDALFVLKMISCRSTDIRDIFMMAPALEDKVWVKKEISARYDFRNRLDKVKNAVTSKKFRDGLQGVYGLVDDHAFERSMIAILAVADAR